MTVIAIPRSYMGTTMHESVVKRGLKELCPDIHFDMGACLNIWHPYRESRQNVYWKGSSLAALDRGTVPEVPVWSTRRDLVEIPSWEVREGEIAMYGTAGIQGTCWKCRHTWDLPNRPSGLIGCPALCENIGDAADAARFYFADKPTERAWVWRKVRDRVILVGWRHTFARIIRKAGRLQIPGISQATVEAKFKVDLSPRLLDAHEIDEDLERRVLDRSIEVA